jgi:hypothetical protein
MKTPYTFPTITAATARLDEYVKNVCDKYGLEYQYEIISVFDSEHNLIGYNIRVKDHDGFGLWYVGPAEQRTVAVEEPVVVAQDPLIAVMDALDQYVDLRIYYNAGDREWRSSADCDRASAELGKALAIWKAS